MIGLQKYVFCFACLTNVVMLLGVVEVTLHFAYVLLGIGSRAPKSKSGRRDGVLYHIRVKPYHAEACLEKTQQMMFDG